MIEAKWQINDDGKKLIWIFLDLFSVIQNRENGYRSHIEQPRYFWCVCCAVLLCVVCHQIVSRDSGSLMKRCDIERRRRLFDSSSFSEPHFISFERVNVVGSTVLDDHAMHSHIHKLNKSHFYVLFWSHFISLTFCMQYWPVASVRKR